jgi:hypothetical protein
MLIPEAEHEKLARWTTCIHREIRKREQVYPKLVKSGRMSQAKADAELTAMREIYDHFQQQLLQLAD